MSQLLCAGTPPQLCTYMRWYMLWHMLIASFFKNLFLRQVAGVCAQDETFIQTCNRIQCPPTEGACTPGKQSCVDNLFLVDLMFMWVIVLFSHPDPVLGGKALGANLGCDVPYYRTPYNAAVRPPRLNAFLLGSAVLITTTLFAVLEL